MRILYEGVLYDFRFLRMRDFDLMKAKDMFLQYLKWREEFHVDAIAKVKFKIPGYNDILSNTLYSGNKHDILF